MKLLNTLPHLEDYLNGGEIKSSMYIVRIANDRSKPNEIEMKTLKERVGNDNSLSFNTEGTLN